MYLHKWLIIKKQLIFNYYKQKFNDIIKQIILNIILKKNNNIDRIEDKCYDIQVNNKKAILDDIMYQVNNQTIVDITKPLIYFIRIWNQYDEKYAYKIGFSTDFGKRLSQINSTSKCYYRIIILACANIDNKQIEQNIHKQMRKKHKNVIIGNPIKSKPTELYNTSYEVYNDFIHILEKMNLDFFKSDNYLLSKEDKLEKFKDINYPTHIVKHDKNKYIYLDKGLNEQKYWLHKYIKFNELDNILYSKFPSLFIY
jgi:hypothetical protein